MSPFSHGSCPIGASVRAFSKPKHGLEEWSFFVRFAVHSQRGHVHAASHLDRGPEDGLDTPRVITQSTAHAAELHWSGSSPEARDESQHAAGKHRTPKAEKANHASALLVEATAIISFVAGPMFLLYVFVPLAVTTLLASIAAALRLRRPAPGS